MKNEIAVLILEDEKAQLQIYEDAIDDFNGRNEIQLKAIEFKNYSDAVMALESPLYDAAIIDLKLSNNKEFEGVNFIESIYKKIRIPIFVVTGNIGQVERLEENSLFRKKVKGEKVSEVFEEIHAIYKTGITSLMRPDGIINQKLSQIFWNNLSTDLNIWMSHNNPNSLLRYILSYFQEYLEINVDGDFEEYHQQEVYLAPPIKKNLHTGDLIKIDDCTYLTLTPACDIILNYQKDKNGQIILDKEGSKQTFRKADKMILARVIVFDYQNLSKSKIEERVYNKLHRYHYLPPFNNESGYLIDFQDLTSSAYDVGYERIASISAPFIKDIISRFANYYSRQGQPTFNQASIVADLVKKAEQKKVVQP